MPDPAPSIPDAANNENSAAQGNTSPQSNIAKQPQPPQPPEVLQFEPAPWYFRPIIRLWRWNKGVAVMVGLLLVVPALAWLLIDKWLPDAVTQEHQPLPHATSASALTAIAPRGLVIIDVLGHMTAQFRPRGDLTDDDFYKFIVDHPGIVGIDISYNGQYKANWITLTADAPTISFDTLRFVDLLQRVAPRLKVLRLGYQPKLQLNLNDCNLVSLRVYQAELCGMIQGYSSVATWTQLEYFLVPAAPLSRSDLALIVGSCKRLLSVNIAAIDRRNGRLATDDTIAAAIPPILDEPLARILGSVGTLQHIDISNNNLSDSVLSALLAPSLRSLNIGRTLPLTRESARRIILASLQVPQLSSVELPGGPSSIEVVAPRQVPLELR